MSTCALTLQTLHLLNSSCPSVTYGLHFPSCTQDDSKILQIAIALLEIIIVDHVVTLHHLEQFI